MTDYSETNGGRRGFPWRATGWSIAALLLLAPLVAMQFTSEMNWGVEDFAFAGIMIIGSGLILEAVVRMTANSAYRIAMAAALAGAFLLIWLNAAVGIIGDEGDPANLMFAGVLAIGLAGAALARFRAGGMAWTLFLVAGAQALVGIVAVAGRLGADGPIWPRDVGVLTVFFTILWLVSGGLFRKAARTGP
ncbi:hypothetical protein [Sphingomonas sp.]|uniref:hypothetical protein n=1 Tax=Sphingomonas sp. TaxID=28214 RepID=UPI002EDB9FE5